MNCVVDKYLYCFSFLFILRWQSVELTQLFIVIMARNGFPADSLIEKARNLLKVQLDFRAYVFLITLIAFFLIVKLQGL